MRITILIASVLVMFLQVAQQGPQRYSYHVWGTVSDEELETISNMTVCVLPSERPINGRIPCTKTGSDGSFAMTDKNIPDKYTVCASTTDSPFILSQDHDKSHRVACTKPIEFRSSDECRKVDLKFERQ